MNVSRFLILLLLTICEPAIARPSPTINIHGDLYQSACSRQSWNELQGNLESLAGSRQPDQLSSLVEVYLCGTSHQDLKRLRRHLPRRIAQAAEETGTTGINHSFRPRKEITPLEGRAWAADARESGSEAVVSYYPNEGCAASATFKFIGGAWLLVAMGEACD